MEDLCLFQLLCMLLWLLVVLFLLVGLCTLMRVLVMLTGGTIRWFMQQALIPELRIHALRGIIPSNDICTQDGQHRERLVTERQKQGNVTLDHE